jgi:hypothetical protein
VTYLLSQQPSEDERLRLQSLVWEPAGRRLLDEIGAGTTHDPRSAVDVGCGALGWLRLLCDWACWRTGRFAAALRTGFERLLPADRLDQLVAASTEELRDPGRTGLPFTIVQTWCVVPGADSRA